MPPTPFFFDLDLDSDGGTGLFMGFSVFLFVVPVTDSGGCPLLLRRGGWPKARRGGQGSNQVSSILTTPAFGHPSS